MTPELWAQLVGAIVTALLALAAYLQSRRSAAAAEKAGEKAQDAKHAAENGVAERTALRERAEKAEQELQAMQLQRDTFRDIVRYVKSRPEAAPILSAYAERRQVAVRDPALDALLTSTPATTTTAPPAPPPALPRADWRPWAGAALAALAALLGGAVLGRKARP